MARLAVVIVTHNSERHIDACLEACARVLPGSEVRVVDNASTDGTRQRVNQHANAVLVANPENHGFAGAVNQGVRASTAPLVVVLNPDTVVESGIERMMAECEAPGIGAAGGRLTASEGRPQAGFMVRRFPTTATLVFETLGINRLWPGNPVNRRYRCLDLDLSQATDVDQPAGAFLMFRRDSWQAIGGMDEGFHPIWFEDVDFCLRLREAGWGIRFVPEAVARHAGAHSIRNLAWETRELWWYASLLRYAAKHLSPFRRRCVALAVMLGALPRAVLASGKRGIRSPVSVYIEVIRLAYRAGLTGVTLLRSDAQGRRHGAGGGKGDAQFAP